jgi:hypothetical protein
MTLILFLLCLFAAALAVGLGALLAALIPAIPSWLLDILRLGALLIAIFWLRAVLGV